MTFEQWLLKQKNRNDAIGDLSRDWINDGKKTPFTYEYLSGISHACEGAKIAFVDAYNKYFDFLIKGMDEAISFYKSRKIDVETAVMLNKIVELSRKLQKNILEQQKQEEELINVD
jgi:hypothetical protein